MVVASVSVAIVLLLLYLAVVGRNLRRHRKRDSEREDPGEGTWSMPAALATLAVATGATAWVSEILVHSLDTFATAVGLSEFFISVVIVAIVGNAAEHGGAIVIAREREDAARQRDRHLIERPGRVARRPGGDAPLPPLRTPPRALVPLERAFRDGSRRGRRRGRRVGRPFESPREGVLLCLAYAAAVVGFYLGGGR